MCAPLCLCGCVCLEHEWYISVLENEHNLSESGDFFFASLSIESFFVVVVAKQNICKYSHAYGRKYTAWMKFMNRADEHM